MTDEDEICERTLRRLREHAEAMHITLEQALEDCFKKIIAAGDEGYQPPLGGPRLYYIEPENPFAGTVRWTKRSRPRHRGW